LTSTPENPWELPEEPEMHVGYDNKITKVSRPAGVFREILREAPPEIAFQFRPGGLVRVLPEVEQYIADNKVRTSLLLNVQMIHVIIVENPTPSKDPHTKTVVKGPPT
jgi:hypothetical protein